ncbi:MAG: AraC family transcriptional regulator [Saccharofermentans sp.]|nr:AraC family transcriptional regulator [Saccharofermentans sp.]
MYKILLADDEGIVIESLRFIVDKEFPGLCEILEAKTGRRVIELAEQERPDIALMDIRMPGINGIDAMREIRLTNPNIVFVIISAYDKFDYAKQALNLGVIDYVNKPFDRSRIVQVVKKAMNEVDRLREQRSRELEVREKLESIIPIVENGLIQDLLSHEHFKENIDEYKKLLKMDEEYGLMLAIVGGEREPGGYMRGAVPAGVKTQENYEKVLLIISDNFKCITGLVMGNKIPVLIPCARDSITPDEYSRIVESANRAQEELTEALDIDFRIGIGPVKPLEQMADSYSEALSILVKTRQTVAESIDLPEGCEYDTDYPLTTEKDLFDAITQGDVARSVKEANNFFDWMEKNSGGEMSDICLKVLEFVLWGERLAYSNGGHVYHFLSRSGYLPEINSMNSYDELRLWFLSHIEKAVNMINTANAAQNEDVAEKAKKYIDQHYREDISLDDLSAMYGISPFYFSKVFKTQTGVTFTDYITGVRVGKARQLLEGTSKSMKEICSEVGYSDPNYFSRIFKKNTGVTPTEYKEGKR